MTSVSHNMGPLLQVIVLVNSNVCTLYSKLDLMMIAIYPLLNLNLLPTSWRLCDFPLSLDTTDHDLATLGRSSGSLWLSDQKFP